MMLRLTIDTPASLAEATAIRLLTEAALERQGITITTAAGSHMDVDLVNVDVVPEGRLV